MNKSSMAGKLAPLLFLLLGTTGLTGIAATSEPKYDLAVASYLKNDYLKALPMFQELGKSDSKNAKVHYYLALCNQQLGNDKDAAAEYEQAIANSKDAAFNEIIKERLTRTNRRLSHTAAAPEEKPAAIQKHDPVQKVILFSTNWCSTCRGFAPSWEKVSKEYQGKLKFEHLNAEDPANFKAVQTYRPKAYPTLVFLDGKNKVIQKYADAPKAEQFSKQLQEMGAK